MKGTLRTTSHCHLLGHSATCALQSLMQLVTRCTFILRFSSRWCLLLTSFTHIKREACGMKCLHPVWTAGMQETSYTRLFVLHGDETPIESRLVCREGLIYASLYEPEWKQPTEESEYQALSVCKSEFKLLKLILLSCFSNCPVEKK